MGRGGDALLALCTSLLVFGQLAWVFKPVDLVNCLLPVIVLLGVVGAAVGLPWSGRPWRTGALLAVLLGIGGRMGAADLPMVTRASAARALRLVQFNAFKDNATPATAARWIAEQAPDIVTLDEALGASRAVVDRLSAQYPYRVSCLSRMRCSTVILSRVAPLASGGLAHGDPENRKALSATWARFASAGGPVTVVAVHLVRPWPWGDQAASQQQLTAFLKTCDPHRTIVVGDFNLTPWNVELHRQDAAIGLARLTHGIPTWPALRPGWLPVPAIMPIDHLYAGDDWTLASLRRSPWLGSDHYALSFVLAERPRA